MKRQNFKLFVTIDSSIKNVQNFLQQHKGYPIDNVIQIKLSKNYFTTLFKGDILTSTSFEQNNLNARYNSEGLLARLENFFTKERYNNYHNLAADITTLIQNTYNDVDINPIKLEKACQKGGQIFNYFFLSRTSYNYTRIDYEDLDKIQQIYDDTSSQIDGIKVYQLIARELDNMISRNVNLDNILQQSTSLEYQYSELDQLYTIYNDEFWNNIQEGDSIFIEGSFQVPTNKKKKNYKNNYTIVGSANLPIILQFIYSNTSTYGYHIAPTIILHGNSIVNWNTFISGLYSDEGASATDFTDKEISLTHKIVVSVTSTHNSQLLGSNLSLSVDNNGNIITTEINEIIPKNYSGQYSQIGNYFILYKVTDVDGLTDYVERNVNINFSGPVNINNIIGNDTYYQRYTNRFTIQNLFYEDPQNYNISFIVIPYNENGYDNTQIPDFLILEDNTGDVIFSDGYSPNSELFIELSLRPSNIGESTTDIIGQYFYIQNIQNSIADMEKHYFNFICVDLVLDNIQNQEYDISTQNSITLPELSFSILEPSSFYYKLSNKNFSYIDNFQFIFDNSITFSSKQDLENYIDNEFLNSTSNQINATYIIEYQISRVYENKFTLQDSKTFILDIVT